MELDCVVAGAGVVGLAIARELAMAGRDVIILEAEERFGSQTSSRNSEVIHAGIYYPQGSLKARLCVEGRQALYQYCRERSIPHRQTGKLIVACETGELTQLAAINAAAMANGVTDLRFLDAEGLHALEPALTGCGALLSPSTGIIDSHALMLSLLGDAEHHGAQLVTHSPLESARSVPGGFAIRVGGSDPLETTCRSLINSAGLGAWQLAHAIEGLPADKIPARWLARGHYFSLTGKTPFSHLVYPVPVPGGLGTHLTLDMAGQARFGPDVQWVDDIDYAVDPARANSFAAAIRRYWPALPDAALQPAYSGIRPKISGPGEPGADFRIEGEKTHGVAGLVNLFGIESPGLTACLAIARQVTSVL